MQHEFHSLVFFQMYLYLPLMTNIMMIFDIADYNMDSSKIACDGTWMVLTQYLHLGRVILERL
jgi:hypothetical protein